jgi:hypothetical protein
MLKLLHAQVSVGRVDLAYVKICPEHMDSASFEHLLAVKCRDENS